MSQASGSGNKRPGSSRGKPRSNSTNTVLSSPSVCGSSPSSGITSSEVKTNYFPCGECRNKVKEGTDAVECEICVKWYHIDCAGLNAEVINSLAKPGVHWFCKKCDAMQMKVGYQVLKLEAKLVKLETEILADPKNEEPVLTDIKKLCSSIASKMDEHIQAFKQQQHSGLKPIIDAPVLKEIKESYASITSKLEKQFFSKNTLMLLINKRSWLQNRKSRGGKGMKKSLGTKI